MGGVTDDGRRRRWVWPVVVAGWAVVLVVAAYVSSRTGEATVREQLSVAQAQSTVDRAAGEVVRASGGVAAGAVPEIRGYDLRTGCRLTAARDGEELLRVVLFTTAASAEDQVMKRIADGLPASYRARVRQGVLRADAGEFVGVRGGIVAPGQVQVTVSTGCRPSAALAPAPADVPDDADQAVDRALAALGVPAAQRRTDAVPCPGGGAARTVAADATPGAPGQPPKAALHGLPVDTDILEQPDVYGYRSGATGVVVRVSDGQVSVAATTGC